MFDCFEHYSCKKHHEYNFIKKNIEKIENNNLTKQSCKKYLNDDIKTVIEGYL